MTVYLQSHYRSWLFCKAYVKTGGSLGGLASELGYRGQGRNGRIRDMWIGKFGIPDHKFNILCKIAEVSESDAQSYFLKKEESTLLSDWVPTLHLYKKSRNPTPEIFLISLESIEN